MRLFKSKLRKRIESHIERTQRLIDEIRNDIQLVERNLNPTYYAKRIVKIRDLQDDIELLKSLL